jgi:hypothetical protein
MDTKELEEVRVRTLQTKDYGAFQSVAGNRALDLQHIVTLKKNMEKYGNLTPNFPVIVNERMEVIDGQHRVAALQELGWPVFYQVQEDLGLEVVQGINQASRNWSWKDFASSYASQGNENYKKLLDAKEITGEGLTVLTLFLSVDGKVRGSIKDGEFKARKWQEALHDLTLLAEIREAAGVKTSVFGQAVFHVISSENYSHEIMMTKLTRYASRFFQTSYGAFSDYARELEDVYNFHNAEKNYIRLF